MDKKGYKKVSEIISHFDFEQIYSVMNYMGWEWGTEERVPERHEIIKFAMKLLWDAYEKKTTVASGGFEAAYFPDVDILKLKFVIEEIEAMNDNEE